MRLISSKRSEAKDKTSYSFSSEIAFVYFYLTAKFTYFSHSLDIKILIFLVILLIVFSEILVNSAIFTASISDEKYHRISLNFFSEIQERTIYLFFNFATLVTFQEHSFHRNLLLFCVSLS